MVVLDSYNQSTKFLAFLHIFSSQSRLTLFDLPTPIYLSSLIKPFYLPSIKQVRISANILYCKQNLSKVETLTETQT